jgi:DNA-binding NarL/FixJ family response regulator
MKHKSIVEQLGLRAPSPREIEVLRRLVCGEANKVIGIQLGISEKTVEAHRANIQRKLGVRGVAELIMKTLRLGLVPMPDFDKTGKLVLR